MFWFDTARAGEPVVGGTVKPVVWADVVPGDFEGEDVVEVDTWARVFANGDLKGADRWFVEGRLQHHGLFGPRPDSGEGTPTEGWWELQLGESGFDAKLAGPVRLRAGSLVQRWGELTLLPVSDVLNARDFRNGLRQDASFQKLATPMAVLSVADRGVRFETTYVPFPVSDRSWLRDTDWSYARPGFTGSLLNEASGFDVPVGSADGAVIKAILASASKSIDNLAPQNRRNLDSTLGGASLPEALLYTGDIAERMVVTGPNAQIALTGGWLRSRQPQSSLSPALATMFQTGVVPDSVDALVADGILVVEWPRTAVAGLDASTLAGPFQLRLDSMFKTAQVIRRYWGAADTSPWLGAGVGADWMRTDVQVTVEARWQHLFDAPQDLMFSREDQIQIAGGVRWVTARERLVAQLGGVFDATFVEGFVRPSIAYRANDHINLELQANLIAGSTQPSVGFLEAGNNTVPEIPAFTYTGGPLSYFQQNDEIGLSIEFIR